MKNLLLLIHDDAGQEARLQTALDLARAFKGHLTCLDVVSLPAVGCDHGQEALQALLLEDEQDREFRNIAALQERLRREDVAWEMLQTTGSFAAAIAANAGLADLIVLSRGLDDPCAPEMGSVAASVALKLHKPVVAVPEACQGFDVGGPALIAWDGSPPVMTALTAAVPLLKLAESVLLYEVVESSSNDSSEEAAAYLSRHGIHVTITRARGSDRPPAILLEERLRATRAAYCVMGAYGHSRFREAIFGGVTRHMLASSQVPLVIAH